jgi:cell division protein FtsX
MKEIGNSLAQLAAIIMVLITLAVSTAAVSQWATADAAAEKTNAPVQTQSLLASDAR